MDIDARYSEIIEALKKDHRWLGAIEQNQIEPLIEALSKEQKLKEVFCILTNTSTQNLAFQAPIIQFLEENNNSDLLIYALNAARKQIIDGNFKQGKRLPAEFLVALEKVLKHKDPEVVSWALRIVDECGPQGVYFLRTLSEIRPSVLKLYNKHYRAVIELIEFIKRKFEPQIK